MRRIRAVLAIVAILVICVLLSTPVLAYLYRAQIAVVESNGAGYTSLPVIIDAPNTWMSDQGFMQNDALDTRATTLGGAEKHHMVADDKTLTVIDVPANSQTNLYFSTGNSDLTAMDIIIGYGGYVTTTDHSDLEIGGNTFSFVWEGYVPSSSATIVSKASAFVLGASGGVVNWTYYHPSGTISLSGACAAGYRKIECSGDSTTLTLEVDDVVVDTESRIVAGSPTNETIRPNGAGDYTGIANVFGAATHWEAVDDVASDADATYVYTTSTTQQKDAYNLGASTIPAGSTINSVTAYAFARELVGTGNGRVQIYLRLSGSESAGSARTTNNVYAPYSDVLARPGGGSWVVSDFADLQVGVGLWETGGVESRCTQSYVTINYTPLILALMTNNANAWVIGNGSPYYSYLEHTVSGTLVLHYEPVTIISGTTLPDRAGTAQNGVITWGANPAGVTATIGSLTSSGQPGLGGEAPVPPRDTLPEIPVSDWFGDGTITKPATLANPFRAFIVAVSDSTTLTEIQVWRWLGSVVWLAVTVWVGTVMRGHQGITAIFSGVFVAGMVAFDGSIFPAYLLTFTAGLFIGGIVAERSPSL